MPEPSQRTPSIATLFTMMFAGQLALTIFLPAVVDMADSFGTSLEQVQLIIPAYLAAFAVMQLAAGPLSDAFGRRPVILGGLLIFAAASFACGFATEFWQLLAGRFLQAMGACTTIVVGRAIIRDTTEGKSAARAMSYLAIALAVGPTIAPLLGGFLVTWFDWRATFYATALLGIGAFVIAAPRFPETLPPPLRRPPNIAGMLRTYGELLRERKFMGYSLTISFLSGTFQTFMVAGPIIMIGRMEVSPQLFGFYVMALPATFMLANVIAGRLTTRISLNAIIGTGVVTAVFGGLVQFGFAITGNDDPIFIVGAVCLSNFGTGLAFACCYAQSLSTVPPSIAGAASALTGFFHMGWAFVVSFILTTIPDISTAVFGITQIATTLASLTAFLTLAITLRPRRRSIDGR